MKKLVIVILSFIAVAMALDVQAADITFNPSVADFKLAPGESSTKSLTVHGYSPSSYFFLLRVGYKQENSDIPASWLNQVYVLLDSNTGGETSKPMNLTINVPDDTIAGTYSGVLIPENMVEAGEPIISPGIMVSIEVTGPQSACTDPPEFSDVEISPSNIWAPSDRDVEITITGNLSVPAGCYFTAGFSMESNNGPVTGDISPAEDGSFSVDLTVNVSRDGQDKPGRLYGGTLFAEDEDGNQTSQDFSVMVLHDKGKKTGQAK